MTDLLVLLVRVVLAVVLGVTGLLTACIGTAFLSDENFPTLGLILATLGLVSLGVAMLYGSWRLLTMRLVGSPA